MSSVRLLRHESDLVPMLWQPSALVQAPPRRDDESTIGLCFSVWMRARFSPENTASGLDIVHRADNESAPLLRAWVAA